MNGTDLHTLRTRYGLSLRGLARMLKIKSYMQIWHWEHGICRIPPKHQAILRLLFLELARRNPLMHPCPLCHGAGLIKERVLIDTESAD